MLALMSGRGLLMIATNGDLDIQKTERKGKTPYKTKGYETLRIKISFFD